MPKLEKSNIWQPLPLQHNEFSQKTSMDTETSEWKFDREWDIYIIAY